MTILIYAYLEAAEPLQFVKKCEVYFESIKKCISELMHLLSRPETSKVLCLPRFNFYLQISTQ